MNKEVEVYKNRVVQSVYNKMVSRRDEALANMTALLETPSMAAPEHLEGILEDLLTANMNISQLETLFGASGEPGLDEVVDEEEMSPECCNKD